MDSVVGLRVHMVMWERGITQGQMVQWTGIDQSSFSKRLRGVRKWTLDEIMTICQVLDLTLGFLLLGDEDACSVTPTRKPADIS
jgi:DNA-binding Xre family transcriptional regulator